MKILYLSTWDFSNEESDGVCKKIYSQIAVFEKKGYEVDFIFIKGEKIVYREGGNNRVIGKVGSIKKTPAYIKMYKKIKYKKYDWVYNRYGMMDTFYYKVLKRLHKNGAKILIEIPTYPYAGEKAKGILYQFMFWWDKIYLHKLKSIIDRIVTYSRDEFIFDIPTIKVRNGIDLSSITITEMKGQLNDVIDLMIVAYMQPYHGYERLLSGLRNYYGNLGERNIHCHFVGEGTEKKVYEELTIQYGLEKHVTFYGPLYGDELNSVFNICDIGICSLGGYKKGMFLSSELKSREFLARGLPIISGVDIDIFTDKNSPYYLQFSNDETDINVIDIINFYDRIYDSANKVESVRSAIRSMARKKISMSSVMLPIIDHMKTV